MKISGPDPIHMLSDPLSEVTRKERRNLIGAAITYIVVVKLGLVPSKISALGIELSAPAQEAFLSIFIMIVGYFLCAFGLYAISDVLVWRKRCQEYFERDEVADMMGSTSSEKLDDIKQHLSHLRWMYKYPSKLSMARATFEFFLPIIIGVYAITLHIF